MSGPGSVSQSMANGMSSSGRLQANPAELVGSQFVSQFYTVLHSSPNFLYRFYTDESTVTHADGGSEAEPPTSVTVATQRHISERVQAMGFQEATTEIWSVDSQYSKDNGVMVLVTGSLQCKGKKKRDFVQSFFLAVQEKGYFVLNDTFRYLSVNHSRQGQAPKENGYHQGPYDKPYLQSAYHQQNYYPTQAQTHNLPQASPSIYSSHPAAAAYSASLPPSAQAAPQPRAELARGHAVTPSMLPSSRQVPQPPKPLGPSSHPAQPPQPAAAATPSEAPALPSSLPEAGQADTGAGQPAAAATPVEKPKSELVSKPAPAEAEVAPPPKPIVKQEAKETKPERPAPQIDEAPAKDPSAPSVPLTYAERLKLGARSSKPTAAPNPISPPASAPAPATAAPKAVATVKAEPTVEVVMDASEPSTTAANGVVTPLPEESLVTSIFVRQLPEGVTQEKLEEAFARFGSIKNVSLRQQPKGKGDFAFVEFEEAAAMQAAIEAKVIIDGRTVTVMERKPMLPKFPRGQYQGERSGRGDARGEGRGPRPGRDSRGRGRGDGRPYTGGRSERGEGREGGRGGRSFSGNFKGEGRIEGSKSSFEGKPDGGRGRGEGRGRGRNSNRAPQSAPPQPRAEQA